MLIWYVLTISKIHVGFSSEILFWLVQEEDCGSWGRFCSESISIHYMITLSFKERVNEKERVSTDIIARNKVFFFLRP